MMPIILTPEHLSAGTSPTLKILEGDGWLMPAVSDPVDTFIKDASRHMISVGQGNLGKYSHLWDICKKSDAPPEVKEKHISMILFVHRLFGFNATTKNNQNFSNLLKFYSQSLNGSTFITPLKGCLSIAHRHGIISEEECQQATEGIIAKTELVREDGRIYLINRARISLKIPSIFGDNESHNAEITSYWELTDEGFKLNGIRCANELSEKIALTGCLPGLEALCKFEMLQLSDLDQLPALIEQDNTGMVPVLLTKKEYRFLGPVLANPKLYNQIITTISAKIANPETSQRVAYNLEWAKAYLQVAKLNKLGDSHQDERFRQAVAGVCTDARTMLAQDTPISELHKTNNLLELMFTILNGKASLDRQASVRIFNSHADAYLSAPQANETKSDIFIRFVQAIADLIKIFMQHQPQTPAQILAARSRNVSQQLFDLPRPAEEGLPNPAPAINVAAGM